MLLLGGLSLVSTADERHYNLQAVDDYILPGYAQLEARTRQLAQETARFCPQPDATGLQRLRELYHLAMDSWQFIQPVRIGPIEQELRGYRLQFWPDKRHSVSRHLTRLLEQADTEALNADDFARGSVAVQGFSALERLLFEPGVEAQRFGSSDDGRFRCRLMLAITRNLAGIVRQLSAQWRPGEASHRELIASAVLGNSAYADDAEVSARLFNGLYTQLESMLDEKLRAPLGASLQQARGKRSESWRSARSLRNLAHNLDGVGRLTESAFLSRLADPPLQRKILDQLARSHAVLEQIELPLWRAVADPTQRPRVEALLAALSELKLMVVGELAAALEIPIGFNSLDGD